jgi:ureidoglycolate lyase
MSMFSCFPRQLRSSPGTSSKVFDVRILERHPFTTQTFIPIDLSSQGEDEPWFLVVVAPTLKGQTTSATTPAGPKTIRNPPDLKNLRAFVARGGQAVTYGAGTWHAPMVVLGSRRVDFVVVQFVNGVDEEDCQEAAFGEGVVVEVGGGRASGSAKL